MQLKFYYLQICKAKVKLSRYHHAGHNGMYSSYSFLISAVDEASGQRHAPALTPEKGPPVPTG
jgi:hypothetical protein